MLLIISNQSGHAARNYAHGSDASVAEDRLKKIL